MYCSEFSQTSFEAGCTEVTPARVCQQTCQAYNRDTQRVLTFGPYCAANSQLSSAQSSARQATLQQDSAMCNQLDSSNTQGSTTCVTGPNNEGSCGYGSSIDQLCAHCDPAGGADVPSCCFNSNTDLSMCASWGHPLASSIRPSQTVATNIGATAMSLGATFTPTASSSSLTNSPSSTGGAGGNNSNGGNGNGDGNGDGNGNNTGADGETTSMNEGSGVNMASLADDHVFSDGQLAGIIVGCIAGALLLGALLALLLMRCCRRDRNDPEANNKAAVYGNVPSGSHVERPWRQSEDVGLKSPELGMKGAEEGKFGAGLAGGAAAAALAGGKSRDSQEDRPISAMSGETGTDGRGTSIPAVKDQYSSHDICPGETVVAIYPYNATLNDEITLQPDDVVTVQRLYDDGWALGRLDSGAEGAFPLVCVTSTKGGTSGSGEGYGSTSGMTSGNDGNITSSVDGAVTADEGAISDATSFARR